MWETHKRKASWWIKIHWKDCPFDLNHIMQNLSDIRVGIRLKAPRYWSWSPPSAGFIVCNVDGASKGNPGPSGVGGVFRDENKKILGYFSLNIGHGWANEAEVRAILNALMFSQEFMLKNIIIESDSTVAVNWVASRENRPWRLSNELNHIDFLISETNCVEVRHVYREGNAMADFLAKEGSNNASPIWFYVDDANGEKGPFDLDILFPS